MEGGRGGLWVRASQRLDACALCPQARSPSCRPYPPAGDEVGGDDLTLGENHVSAVQEGEGTMGLLQSSPFASAYALAKFTHPVSQHLLPFSPTTPSDPCPMTHWSLGSSNRSRAAGLPDLMGPWGGPPRRSRCSAGKASPQLSGPAAGPCCVEPMYVRRTALAPIR